ncbi:type II toxin-antitoxin system ParD family antitoxin [Rhizobiaceae sp. 2RAB30]
MRTLTISLPTSLESFVDQQVSKGGYGTSSEYILDLIRRDQARELLRSRLLDGASSPPTAPVTEGYFEGLRHHVRDRGET